MLRKSYSSPLLIAIISLIFGSACEKTTDNGTPVVTHAAAADFADTANVAATVHAGFRLDLWAPKSLLSAPVAISMDPMGRAYVSETQRRKSSDIDIREHRDWMTEDLSLSSLEATEAFHKAKLAPSLGDKNTWQGDFNGDGSHDWRDLEVESERIRLIYDEDGDGKADASHIFAEDFRSMLTGVAAGVLFHQDEVFLTAAPDLWRVQDPDHDGDMDQKTSISHGYGIHIGYAGHDMSGLTVGPDGKIYWSIGDLGVNTVDQTGKRWAFPHQGAVMRCNPDGSEFEVFAHGLRNPQELAFDEYGNLISVDNDGDHPGEHERIVHILEGSDTGWRTYWQFGKYNQPGEEYKIWMDERLHVPHFPGQAAYILPPVALAEDGPAGLAYNPGTAMGESWKNYFFSSHFKGSSSQSLIQAFKLQPKGASFEVADAQTVVQGINNVGVSFGPDGALYVVDWLDSYDKKDIGRIWRLDVTDNSLAEARQQTRDLLARGMVDLPLEELVALMAYDDMRVRMAAQFELVERGETETLKRVLADGPTLLARLHAVWGLGQLIRKEQVTAELLLPYLEDADAELRAQVAKVWGECRYEPASEVLIPALADASPRVRLYAAEALGKVAAEGAFDPLVELLEQTGDTDPHLRHAVMLALSRIGPATRLAALEDHPSPEVRLGAVVALRRLQAPEVARFLQDSHPWVLVEAARAIHDDGGIEGAMAALAQSLEEAPTTEEAFLRRAINANLRLADAASAARLVAFTSDNKALEALREDALRAIGYWADAPVLDRVEGAYYTPLPHDPQVAIQAAGTLIQQLISTRSAPVSLRSTAAEIAGKLGYQEAAPLLYARVDDATDAPPVRGAALSALAALQSPQLKEAIDLALQSTSGDLRQEAQRLIPELGLPETEMVDMLTTAMEHASPREQQQIITTLGQLNAAPAGELLASWMDRLLDGTADPAIHLELITAAEQSEFQEVKDKLAAFEAQRDSSNELASHMETLYGGNPQRGLRLFFRQPSAQCVRCHKFDNYGGGYGGEVGPNLTGIGSELSREELLAALIAPSQRLAPGYGTVILSMKDDKKMSGVLMKETAQTLTIKNGSGKSEMIPVAQIAEKQIAPSGMPTMKGVLSKDEIRDLVAFLASEK